MRRVTTHYREVATSSGKFGACPVCGKGATRARTFQQTLNPFNKGSDGLVKTEEQIRSELQARKEAWLKRPTYHAACHAKVTPAFDEFFRGYLAAALWSSSDTHPVTQEDVELDKFDWAPGQAESLKADARDFFDTHYALLAEYVELRVNDGRKWEYAGHDFWLNRCEHGCGFWDRDCGEVGDKLADLVGHGTDYPNIDLTLGDDLLVYAQ
ncbi:hypothetical protein D3C85_1010260 [compost metagenome]